MLDLKDKQILVVGLGGRGRAACGFLRRCGAKVTAVDREASPELREAARRLRLDGVEVQLGVSLPPERKFDLAVISPAIPAGSPIVRKLAHNGIPVLGELELAFRQSKCLNVAIAGTNGKGTTARLIEHLLLNNHRKVIRSGHGACPVGDVADRTKDLDLLLLQVNSFQLELTQSFRPSVAVLLNLAPDHLDRYASKADYVRAHARLFRQQEPFDWAIVQTEALGQLEDLGLRPPSKIITFSASDRNSDLCLHRGLIISRLANWSGPLLDTDQCRLRGPHNAENLMAALATGHALRLSLEAMVDALKEQPPSPHCFETIAEVDGVQFIDDSKATNVDALRCALLAVPPGEAGEPNIWLISGGKDRGLDFHAVGPLLARRVKGACLIGEAREKIRAAWSLFTPCTLADSLLEAVTDTAKNATPGDVVLLSPACSSVDQFQNYLQRGEKFSQIVNQLVGVGQAATPI